MRHAHCCIYLFMYFWPREVSTEMCILRLQGNLSKVGNVEDNAEDCFGEAFPSTTTYFGIRYNS